MTIHGQQTEASIVQGIRMLLTTRGAWNMKVHGGPMGRAGIPDVIACYRGVFVAIEVKRPGAKPTPHQRRELDAIHSADGHAVIATSKHDVLELLARIDKETEWQRD